MFSLSALYKHEISYIQFVQEKFAQHESIMHTITEWGDPGHAFTILLPVIASFNTIFGIEFLIALVFSDWLNILLKWLLMEDRPYWWVRETDAYKKLYERRPILYQTSATCETGPGSPSGHLMVSAALLYVIVQWWIRRYDNRIHNANKKMIAKTCIWLLYGIALIAVALSRFFVATHFPHQCILGAICGFVLAHYLTNENNSITIYWKNSSCGQLLKISCLACAISFAAYWIQKGFGIDPQWSIKLAFKWCEQPESINVNTTPLYTLVRDCGTMFGLAIILPTAYKFKAGGSALVRVAVTLFMSFVWFAIQQSTPTHNVSIFYTIQFITHAIQPILLLGAVPYISREKEKKN